MSIKLFITGTDTEVGKTYVTAGLLVAFNKIGLTTLGIKPIASGCLKINKQLCSSDTLILQQSSSIKLNLNVITPFAFEPAIAPHIAATQTRCHLTLDKLNKKIHYALSYDANISVIEGCGGWFTPLNHSETMADFALAHQLNIILVVGIRLGCINHSFLTLQAMQREGANIVGWIANCIDPMMLDRKENIAFLKETLSVPCLGTVEYAMPVESTVNLKQIIENTLLIKNE
ncbi:MAG: dethiobiotin synthase [Gammaproteobacteria bacterium]|nr:dethiobiotin synthase [Gammaproteobacteria bacterium]MCW5583112.1 dethiobiotin synthase [Gammaproteobacteria bacterium]